MPGKRVLVLGGGLAGISSALALAEKGFAVSLFERRAALGGRASSFVEPGSGELVDNCQHVTMRCCDHFERLLQKLGAAGKISYQREIPMIDQGRRRSRIRASWLPAPFHLMPSLLWHRSLTLGEKISLSRAMLGVIREGPEFSSQKGRRLAEWLRERGQGQRQIDAFWGPLLVSALNEEIERMESRAALRVVYRGLLSRREAWQVGLPGAALGEITARPGLAALQKAGVRVALRKTALRVELGEKSSPFRLRFTDGETAEGDALVLALAHPQIQDLLPESLRHDTFFARVAAIESSPIVGVHLWFDREILEQPYLAAIGGTVQWVFRHPGHYVGLVVSAARGLEGKGKEQILEACLDELRKLLPAAREAKLLRSLVVKERAATFSATPQGESLRPPARTPAPGLFLAGDWIDTGWPATMEGAVRGGLLAAEAALEFFGEPAKLIVPELPAAGLVRWLSRG